MVPGVLDSSELIVLTFLRTTHTTLETSPVTAFDHDTPAETLIHASIDHLVWTQQQHPIEDFFLKSRRLC